MNRFFASCALLISSLAVIAQAPVIVAGDLTGANSPVTVNILTIQGTMPNTSVSVNTDSSGYFADTLMLSSNTGWIQVWFVDCTSNVVNASDSYQMTALGANVYFPLNYCNAVFDCLGVPNGPAVPGSPCDDNDSTTVQDTYQSDCSCSGFPANPCYAGFQVNQAIDVFTGQAVPGMLSVLPGANINPVGTLYGYQYLWDFGDGSTSTAAFPSHTYSGNGPYLLCFTVNYNWLGTSCSNTFCDTVSVDSAGIIIPIQPGSSGFTINVGSSGTVGLSAPEEPATFSVFPNPCSDFIQFDAQLQDVMRVYDSSGKLMDLDGPAAGSLDVRSLTPGIYYLQLERDGTKLSCSFLKH